MKRGPMFDSEMGPRQSLSPHPVILPQLMEEAFNDFWEAYPSRGAYTNPKKAAKISYQRALLEGADPEVITTQARAYKDWCDVMGINRSSLVAMATTWLNQTRWENDYTIGWHLLRQTTDAAERAAMEIRLQEWHRRNT